MAEVAEAVGSQTSDPEASLEARLIAHFAGEPAPSPEPQPEPPAPDVKAQDADVVEDEVTPDDIQDDEAPEASDESQTDDSLEITWNGEPVKVAKDEVKNLAQLGYHLQKARATVTAELEQAQTHARSIQQAVQQIEQTVPQLQAFQSQLSAMEIMANAKGLTPQNILEVSRVDPARAQEMQAEFNVMSNQYAHLKAQADIATRQFAHQRRQVEQQMEQAEVQLLARLNPNLKDPVQRDKAREMLDKAIAGWRPESVAVATKNAEILDLLIDGARYRNLKATKGAALATAAKAPAVVRPGSSTKVEQNRVSRDKSMRAQFKKTGSVDDFASLLIAKGFK